MKFFIEFFNERKQFEHSYRKWDPFYDNDNTGESIYDFVLAQNDSSKKIVR